MPPDALPACACGRAAFLIEGGAPTCLPCYEAAWDAAIDAEAARYATHLPDHDPNREATQ